MASLKITTQRELEDSWRRQDAIWSRLFRDLGTEDPHPNGHTKLIEEERKEREKENDAL